MKTASLAETLKVILSFSQGERDRLSAQNHGHLNTAALVDAGWLRAGDFIESWWCDCGPGGLSDVIWVDVPKDGTSVPFYRCDECGLARLKPKDLYTWTIPIPHLVERIGESLGLKPPFMEAVPGVVWSLGRKMRREFYYVRGVESRKERSLIKTYFTPHPTAVLIVPMDGVKNAVAEDLPNNLCFSVESFATFDEDYNLLADLAQIETEVKPIVESKKKPMARRGNRAANIERLTHELEQHILAARDHVCEFGDLLPRPTLQQLGKLAGLEKHDVTRCMKDPDAQKLRYLWKVAEDIKRVRDWNG